MLRISHSAAVDEWRGRERASRSLGLDIATICAASWEEGGAIVTPHPRPGERVRPTRTLGSHPALFVFDPLPILRALRAGPDVIDIHEEPFALVTAEVLLLRWLSGCRAPFILYTAQNLEKRYPVPFRWFERFALGRAAGLSACNREAARISRRKGLRSSARVIPLGIDLSTFTPGPPRAAGEAITVGFVGRLVPEKGILVLLDALAHDRRLRARIAGGGPLGTTLPAEITQRGLSERVELVGPIDSADVVAFYHSVDVMAVPSIARPGWTEQFGRVAVEAMACGVPVVASDAGALPDVVAGAGIIVAEGDSVALADALVRASTIEADELRERGRARAAECSWDAVARDYLALYEEASKPAAWASRAGSDTPST